MDRSSETPGRDQHGEGRLPEFIIAGAMKCGTSSLHHILANHSDVFIPEGEIAFFDIDDLQQHPDFLIPTEGGWYFPDFEQNREAYLRWYRSFFVAARADQIVGEDSTTYIASAKAAERIAAMLPAVKIVVMLRDPAARSYSHYWHQVRNGRAVHDFERTLRFGPGTLLQRSLYRAQALAYLEHFPRANLHFILFEDFVANMPRVIQETCRFLGLPPTVDLAKIDTHRNRALTPRHPRLRLLGNRLLRRRSSRRYADHLPGLPPSAAGDDLFGRTTERVLQVVTPLIPRRPPPMHPATHRWLNRFFARENEGLSELIGTRVEQYWYRDPGTRMNEDGAVHPCCSFPD